MHMNRGIIFDLDGTLANTLPDILRALNKTLSHFHFPLASMEDLMRYINRGSRQLVFDAIPKTFAASIDDEKVTTCLQYYTKSYEEEPMVETYPYEGMASSLQKLKEQGYHLAVLSNKQDHLVKTIVSSLFPGVFEIVSGQTELPTKPDPTSALLIAKRMNVQPQNCIFCGDSDIDMQTGVNAGMIPLAVIWGYRDINILKYAGAAYFVKEPKELCPQIDKIFPNI